MKRIKTVVLFIIVCGIFLHAENKRPFTISDYFKTQDISDIRNSPDGEKVAFVKREIIADKSEKDFVDSQRLGVTRVSYGWCMTTWIVGHTERFAAAVAERFVADNYSSFGVDDTAYWYEKDFGLPYDEKNFSQYRKTSPILYIKNCTTPILIMHCMEDHRCPLPQALQFYMGLKKLKKTETQLILYPREPHGIREIPHQSDRLRRIVSWFDNYLKK